MTTAFESKPNNVEHLDIERDWHDGLKAIDEQYEEAEASRQRWLRIGKGLLAGRLKCPATRDFGKWLDSTGYRVLSTNERQDAVWVAVNSELVMPALRESRVAYPSRVRRHVRENMRAIYVQCQDNLPGTAGAVPGQIPANEAEKPAAASVLQITPPLASQRAVIGKLPRGDEVYAIFASRQSRAMLGRVCRKGSAGKEIWDLILVAVDNGFLAQTNIRVETVTARVLFPNSPRVWWQKFNLTNQKHREHVRDVIMPAAIANKEAILKSPREIDRIITEHLKATAATVQKEAAEKKVVAAIKALPAREREVIFYGERMWPVVNPTYDFDQLCAAIWSFQDLNRWLLQTPDNSVGSRGRIIRFTTKWMQEYINRMVPSEAGSRIKKIYLLIDKLSRALENNPHGECRVPPPPHIEGQW
jgi:hypothetical protein